MIEVNSKAAQLVASHSRVALMDIDRAFATHLRLTAEAVETISGSGVPSGQSQKLMRSFHSGAGKLIEGRGDLVAAIGQLQVMQRASNVAETDFGCVAPWALQSFTVGKGTEIEPVIEKATIAA